MINKAKRLNEGMICFNEVSQCLRLFNFSEKECLAIFKYLYYLETDHLMEIVDRNLRISCQML